MSLVLSWLITFVITLVVEIAVAWPILGLVEMRRWRRLVLIVLVNLLTHPIVFGLARLPRSASVALATIFILELGASIVEALIYRRALLAVRRSEATLLAVAASFLANAASLLTSLFVWRFV